MTHSTSSPRPRETLSIIEAGQALGIGRTLAYELARSGRLPTLRLGGRKIVVPRAALDRMLAAPSAAPRP